MGAIADSVQLTSGPSHRTKSLTVLQLISSGGFYGAESMLVSLSESLTRISNQVLVGVFEDSRDPHVEVAEVAQRNGLPTHLIPSNGRWDFRAIGRVRRLIQLHKIDVVHAHGYKADIYAYLAALGTKTRLVSTCHNWPDPAKRMQTYAKLDRLVLKGFHHITTPSPIVERVLRQSGIRSERLSFLSNGVDLTRFDHAEPTLRRELSCGDRPIVGFVGRLVTDKGGEVLLNAAKTVLAEHPNALFVFVGDGPSHNAWNSLADSLGISQNVIFAGIRRDMPGVYASFDVMVLPSFDEAMPMCLLEAMAASRATIATRVGAVPELISHGISGLLLEPRMTTPLSEAISQLLNSAEMRKKLGLAARAHIAENYSADAMAQKYLERYH